MNTSAAIADPLLRRAFGQRARPSDPHRTARVRIGASGLHALVSRRGSAISRRTVMNNAGWCGRARHPERGGIPFRSSILLDSPPTAVIRSLADLLRTGCSYDNASGQPYPATVTHLCPFHIPLSRRCRLPKRERGDCLDRAASDECEYPLCGHERCRLQIAR